MKKILIPDENIRLSGLPWYEHNKQRIWRLPYEIEDAVGEDIWAQSKETSGIRISFCSDTTTLSIKIKNTGKPYPAKNMCKVGQMGYDLHVDGQYWGGVLIDEETEGTGVFVKEVPKKFREYTIYYPLYYQSELLEVKIDDDAVIKPPKPYACPKPVIFYGTSITQGGAASRSGLSYQAILCRDLNLDFVNLGYSGLGLGEQPIAEAMAGVDAAGYVLDYGVNNKTADNLREVYIPFINTIRSKQKETPIILITPIFSTKEVTNPEISAKFNGLREVVREAYKTFSSAGDNNIYLIEGYNLLSPDDADGLIDGTHPNDIGFWKMAKGLRDYISNIILQK